MNPFDPALPPSSVTPGTEPASSGVVNPRQNITASARDAAAHLKSAASDTAARARDEVQRLAADKKSDAAERLGGYSSAIHESARSLEEKDPNLAWFTHRAADRLQGVADYVRDRDFQDLRHDAEDVARRHPALFFGGLFVAGLLVGNLLKASARRAADGATRSTDEGASDWAATNGLSDPSVTSGI